MMVGWSRVIGERWREMDTCRLYVADSVDESCGWIGYVGKRVLEDRFDFWLEQVIEWNGEAKGKNVFGGTKNSILF